MLNHKALVRRFIPNILDGVKVRTQVQAFQVLSQQTQKTFLYGPEVAHRVIVMLKCESTFAKLLGPNTAQ